MDLVDEAQARAEREREAAVEAVRETTRRTGRLNCRVCADAIGEDRRRAMPSADCCFECQERIERARQLRRR